MGKPIANGKSKKIGQRSGDKRAVGLVGGIVLDSFVHEWSPDTERFAPAKCFVRAMQFHRCGLV